MFVKNKWDSLQDITNLDQKLDNMASILSKCASNYIGSINKNINSVRSRISFLERNSFGSKGVKKLELLRVKLEK